MLRKWLKLTDTALKNCIQKWLKPKHIHKVMPLMCIHTLLNCLSFLNGRLHRKYSRVSEMNEGFWKLEYLQWHFSNLLSRSGFLLFVLFLSVLIIMRIAICAVLYVSGEASKSGVFSRQQYVGVSAVSIKSPVNHINRPFTLNLVPSVYQEPRITETVCLSCRAERHVKAELIPVQHVPSIRNMNLWTSEAAGKWNTIPTSHWVLHCSCYQSDHQCSKRYTWRRSNVSGWKSHHTVTWLRDKRYSKLQGFSFGLRPKQQEQKLNPSSDRVEKEEKGGGAGTVPGCYLHAERPVRGGKQERSIEEVKTERLTLAAAELHNVTEKNQS